MKPVFEITCSPLPSALTTAIPLGTSPTATRDPSGDQSNLLTRVVSPGPPAVICCTPASTSTTSSPVSNDGGGYRLLIQPSLPMLDQRPISRWLPSTSPGRGCTQTSGCAAPSTVRHVPEVCTMYEIHPSGVHDGLLADEPGEPATTVRSPPPDASTTRITPSKFVDESSKTMCSPSGNQLRSNTLGSDA